MNTNILVASQLGLQLITQGLQIMQTVQAAHAAGTDISEAQLAQALSDAQAAGDGLQAAIAANAATRVPAPGPAPHTP